MLRTTTASRASTKPPARTTTSASVSASPVALSGSRRAARTARRPAALSACSPGLELATSSDWAVRLPAAAFS